MFKILAKGTGNAGALGAYVVSVEEQEGKYQLKDTTLEINRAKDFDTQELAEAYASKLRFHVDNIDFEFSVIAEGE